MDSNAEASGTKGLKEVIKSSLEKEKKKKRAFKNSNQLFKFRHYVKRIIPDLRACVLNVNMR